MMHRRATVGIAVFTALAAAAYSQPRRTLRKHISAVYDIKHISEVTAAAKEAYVEDTGMNLGRSVYTALGPLAPQRVYDIAEMLAYAELDHLTTLGQDRLQQDHPYIKEAERRIAQEIGRLDRNQDGVIEMSDINSALQNLEARIHQDRSARNPDA